MHQLEDLLRFADLCRHLPEDEEGADGQNETVFHFRCVLLINLTFPLSPEATGSQLA